MLRLETMNKCLVLTNLERFPRKIKVSLDFSLRHRSSQINLKLHGQLQENFDARHETGDFREVGTGHHLRVKTEAVSIVTDLN